MLSILSSGLLVTPMNAVATGKAFGNGTYTADVFEKSFNYTYEWTGYGRTNGKGKYLFLCDVALGRVFDHNKDGRGRRADLYPPRDSDSVVVLGGEVPDPLCTMRIDGGLDVPLGPVVSMNRDRGSGYFFGWWGHSEFITYKDSQTALRYLVRLRWGP